MTEQQILSLAQSLLEEIDGSQVQSLSALPGGRNNRVFKLITESGRYLFKLYYHSPNDPRDRLNHEYSFLTYMHGCGSTLVPRAFACDKGNKASIIEFLDGKRVPNEEVGREEIEQYGTFFLQANQTEHRMKAASLPMASEACFSLAEHMEVTQRRVDRLRALEGESGLEQEAKAFVADMLIPSWEKVKARISRSGLDLEQALSLGQRVISPSDIGFHNTLRMADGTLRFIDFEFSGWDDPAKLISDFRNQPDFLLAPSLSEPFTQAVIESSDAPEALLVRLDLLEPLYQVKWGCICLNHFLHFGKTRMRFLGQNADDGDILRAQLNKAEIMVARALQDL